MAYLSLSCCCTYKKWKLYKHLEKTYHMQCLLYSYTVRRPCANIKIKTIKGGGGSVKRPCTTATHMVHDLIFMLSGHLGIQALPNTAKHSAHACTYDWLCTQISTCVQTGMHGMCVRVLLINNGVESDMFAKGALATGAFDFQLKRDSPAQKIS